jgi:hypothetical protein
MKDMMILSKNPDLFWDRIDNDVVACCSSTGEFFRFNKIGHLIWDMCDGCTLEALIARISSLFPDNDPCLLDTETRKLVGSLLEFKLLVASTAEDLEKANLSHVGTN